MPRDELDSRPINVFPGHRHYFYLHAIRCLLFVSCERIIRLSLNDRTHTKLIGIADEIILLRSHLINVVTLIVRIT